MTIKELRAKTGLSQSKFAARFNIPVRTLQGWEMGRSKTPVYIIFMIERILELEEKINQKGK